MTDTIDSSPGTGAGADPVQALHTGENWFVHLFPLRVVVPAAVVAIACGLVAIAMHAPTMPAVGAGMAVFVLGAARVRDASLLGYAGKRITFQWNKSRRVAESYPEPFDVPVDEGQYGMCWEGRRLVTMLRIDVAPHGITLLSPGHTSAEATLPLPEIARCLTQFDIGLAAIDVISSGSRAYGDSPVSRLYQRVLGPLPAAGYRTVWLALRLDPLANVEAIERRGGGPVGIIRAATVATRRVANRMAALGIDVSILTAADMQASVRQLTDNADLSALTEHWNDVQYDGGHTTTFRIDPDQLTDDVLNGIWAVPSQSITMLLRICPGPGMHQGRHGADGDGELVAISAMARFTTPGPLSRKPGPGLQPLPGAQYHALLSTLPFAPPAELPSAAPCRGTPQALAALTLPATGCGQLVGADDAGRGVAVPLLGPTIRRVEIIGSLQLAQQVILRALALGARVLVHTNRPGAWTTLVETIGVPEMISVSNSSTANPLAGPSRAPAGQSANVLVFDDLPAAAHIDHTTVVNLRPRGKAPQSVDADVTLTQALNSPNLVTVRTPNADATVHMVATADEMTYLGASFTSWQMGA